MFEVTICDLKVDLYPEEVVVAKTERSIPAKHIEHLILMIRGEKVLLDSDLAQLYGVETKKLVQAMKRHLVRFP